MGEHHFIGHLTNSNIIFQTLNELERVHVMMIKLERLNFGFERMNIEHGTKKAFTRFAKSFIEQTQTSFFEH